MSIVENLKMKAKLLVKAKKRAGIRYALKDALDAMARRSGYKSWRELRASDRTDDLYARGTGVFPNHWCKSYEEAKSIWAVNGGVLLPYQHQFFVCPVEHLQGLGVSKADPDLELVGYDWVSPRDPAALQRLKEKMRQFRTESKTVRK